MIAGLTSARHKSVSSTFPNMRYETSLMKQLFLRCWMVTIFTGVGCAVGSGPSDVRDQAAATNPIGDDTKSEPVGDDAASPDAVPVDPTEDGGTNDAATKDASTKDSSVADATVDSGPTGPCSFTGALALFDLSTLSGSPLDLPAKTTATGVTTTPLARAGVSVASSSGAMNASNWPTGARDTGKHFVFSVSPPSGCSLR